MGKQEQIRAQHPGDRAARANHWNSRLWIRQRLRKHGRDSTNQIKDNKPAVPHGIFDVVAKNPQVQHVAAQVHESAVQKHRRKRRQHRVHPFEVRYQPRVVQDDGGNDPQCVDRRFLTRAQ